MYGNLNGRGTCAIGARLNSAPGPGNVYTCSFSATFIGDAGASQTDIVTVTVVDDENTPANDTDDARVTITNVLPTIAVTKTPSPASRTVPGGDFTFTVTVRNTSNESVQITALSDDVFGNLNGRGTCAIGAVLQPNAVYTCSFTGTIQSNTPGSHTDVVTATAVDNEGSPAVGRAQATVRLEAAAAVASVQGQQIARTGDDTRGPAGLAAALVALGMVLVALARRRQLALAPVGDDHGPFAPPWGGRPGAGMGLGLGGDAPLGGSGPPRPNRALRALGAAFSPPPDDQP